MIPVIPVQAIRLEPQNKKLKATWINFTRALYNQLLQGKSVATDFERDLFGKDASSPPRYATDEESRTVESENKSDEAKSRGNSAMAEGLFEEAYEHYTTSLHHNPYSLAARNNRALVLLKLGRFAEAVSLALRFPPSLH